jgi:peptidoglycan/LPS O-acetylase OafA/YrhL
VERKGNPPPAQGRVEWVDGVRAAAAMFVVLHHIWLGTWPGYPRNTGPWWVGWMLYGQLAVAVFIVVSGFSLSLAPLSRGASLNGGARRFLSRRAWRILPPYWAAIAFSTVVAVIFWNPGLHAIVRGVTVHALLLQDITHGWVVNGAFWSIAIEWQIYFLFPLILLLARRRGVATAVACTVLLVFAAQALTHLGPPFTKIDHLTPQFLALFALGIFAVDLGRAGSATVQRGLLGVAFLAFGAVVFLGVAEGSAWMVSQFFTVDILFGVGVASLMAVMYGGGLRRVRRALASHVGLRLGLFSYSIYLLHAPILGVLEDEVLNPMHLATGVRFSLLLVVGIPIILVICYGFHLVFEAPFLALRGPAAIRTMPIIRAGSRLLRRLGNGPVSAALEAAAPPESG